MPILEQANFNFKFYDSICSPLNSAPMKIIAKAIMYKVFLIFDKSIYNMSIALNNLAKQMFGPVEKKGQKKSRACKNTFKFYI